MWRCGRSGGDGGGFRKLSIRCSNTDTFSCLMCPSTCAISCSSYAVRERRWRRLRWLAGQVVEEVTAKAGEEWDPEAEGASC